MNFCCSNVSKAVINNDIDKLKELLNKKARIDIQDNLGYSSLHIAAKNGADINPEIIDLLLNHPDVEINARSFEGHTCLYVACDTNNPNIEIIKKLLYHGVDPNIPDNEDISPLHLACKYAKLELVQLLVSHNANVDKQDFNGYTPTHEAIESDQKEIVLYLIKSNATQSLKTLHNLTPIMLAIIRKRNYVEDLIPLINHDNMDDDFRTCLLVVKLCSLDILIKLFKIKRKFTRHHYAKIVLDGCKTFELDKFICVCEIFISKVRINTNFIERTFRFSYVFNNFTTFSYLVDRTDIKWHIKGRQNIFVKLFHREMGYQTEEHFQGTKEVYVKFIRRLVSNGIKIDSKDLEEFIKFFACCNYSVELLTDVMSKKNVDVTEYIVLYALKNNIEMSTFLLQYCIHFDSTNLFKYAIKELHLPDNLFKVLKRFLLFFTPSFKSKQDLLLHIGIVRLSDDERLILKQSLSNNVKSLTEICRDKIRAQLQDICDDSIQYINVMEQLNLPKPIKDLIACKFPIK